MPSPSAQLLHESRLLVPYPLTAHLNDWPIFSLSNCHVTDPSSSDSSELVNLLHADALRPLTLTGTLSSPSKDQAHLFLPPSPSHPHHLHKLYTIQVTDIKQYAYGQYEDGGVEIWVAGQAGWFTVKPSRSYKSVHQGMVQAIQLLYFAADVYKASQEQLQESHKGRGRPRKYSVDRTDVSAANVFAQYADAHPSICASSEEAAELFYTHKRFLMSSMLAGKEGLSWSAIPIFRHLEHKFPDEIRELRQRLAANKAPVPRKQSGSATPQSQASSKRKRATPSVHSKASATPIPAPEPVPGSMQPPAPPSREERYRARGARAESEATPVSTPRKQSVASGSEEPSEEDDDDDIIPARAAQKGRSALRPRPSKFVPVRRRSDTIEDGEIDVDQTNGTIPVSARPVKRKSVDELEPIGKRRQNGKAPIWEAETIPELADDDEAEDVYGDEDIDIPEEAAFDEATLPSDFKTTT
ncbi:hypothetical protein H2203_001840 [Taxawa tesnikishii (nom. ined.)]|nr:hypothetical protein H2203_001840 [Dothideales sp. JES 119]